MSAMKRILKAAAALTICAMIAGCGGNLTAKPPVGAFVRPRPTSEPPNDQPAEFESKRESVKRRSMALTKAAESFDEVSDAYVVISGNTAIIGLNLTGDLDDSRIISLKRDIEAEALSIDDEISHVAVTASPELVDRIINMIGGDTANEDQADDAKFYQLTPVI
jgi:YhcN/YlaJ family sporulation lipoprotein